MPVLRGYLTVLLVFILNFLERSKKQWTNFFFKLHLDLLSWTFFVKLCSILISHYLKTIEFLQKLAALSVQRRNTNIKKRYVTFLNLVSVLASRRVFLFHDRVHYIQSSFLYLLWLWYECTFIQIRVSFVIWGQSSKPVSPACQLWFEMLIVWLNLFSLTAQSLFSFPYMECILYLAFIYVTTLYIYVR